MYIHIHIYIYIYRERERELQPADLRLARVLGVLRRPLRARRASPEIMKIMILIIIIQK